MIKYIKKYIKDVFHPVKRSPGLRELLKNGNISHYNGSLTLNAFEDLLKNLSKR